MVIINYITAYLEELFELSKEMAPYLLIGFFFAGILHVFFKKEKIARYMGSNKIKSAIYAALIGIPLPLCSCGVIPTGVSFYKNGASKGATVSFLISTPQTGVDSILVTYSMLGLPFALIRPIVAFVSGIFGGAFTNYYAKDNNKQKENLIEDTQTEETSGNVFKRFFKYAFVEFLQDISKWLIIGLLLAALISLLLPDDFFAGYINNPLLSMGIVLLASIPLYVCATGSVPIAAVLMMKGLSPGAALVFLMAGPATNAATITVLGKVLGKKALTAYLASIIGMALAFGLFIDNFLPSEWFTQFLNSSHTGHQHNTIPVWLQTLSVITLALMIINGYFQKYKHIIWSKAKNKNKTNELYSVIKVEGMTCNHCKTSVSNGLTAKGINIEDVDLVNSTVKIKGNITDEKLIAETINSLGYNYKGIINKPFKNRNMETYKISIKGMTCNHCTMNVEKTVKQLQGIKEVKASLSDNSATIKGENINLEEIKKAIESIGYEYTGTMN